MVMQNHLLNEIFKEHPPDHTKPPIHLKITFYDWLKQLPHSVCPNWHGIRKHRLTEIRKVGLRRIERELDVARFIKKQLALTAIIKALTTKTERNYLKQNYRFMVGE